jgi:hypothetical protein
VTSLPLGTVYHPRRPSRGRISTSPASCSSSPSWRSGSSPTP